MPASRFLVRLALLVVAILGQPASAANRPIVVAQGADLSGPNADFGRDYAQGARIYFDHVNAGGGIGGRRIAYLSRDTGGSPNQGLALAQAFAREGASVLFGFTGDDTVEAVARDKTVQATGLTLFAPVAGNTSLTPRQGVYYLRASIAQEIRAMVGHLAPLGIRSFAIATADEHGREAAQALAAEAARQGAQVVAQSRLESSNDGPAKAARNLAAARPQAVIVIADTVAAALFFQQYRSLDPGAFLCAPSLVNVRTLTAMIGPKAARGLIVSQVVPDPSAFTDLTREHRKLMERYTDEPASAATLEGFMAAKALVQAIKRSKDGAATPASFSQAIRADGRFDLGGYELDFARPGRASAFVELTVINREGRLLR